METSRIQTLDQLLAQDPANVFARYSLAMEYLKTDNLTRAVEEFGAVIVTDPTYAAAYYHGGQTFEKMGMFEDARDFYRRGIAVARDPHARSELQAALDILGD